MVVNNFVSCVFRNHFTVVFMVIFLIGIDK